MENNTNGAENTTNTDNTVATITKFVPVKFILVVLAVIGTFLVAKACVKFAFVIVPVAIVIAILFHNKDRIGNFIKKYL